MEVYNLLTDSDLESELKSLLSDEYMFAFFKSFCNAIRSRIWRLKRGKSARYNAEDFLKVFFFAEVTGRSIDDASELLNSYYLSKKKGRRKIFADGRKKREVPHQTDVNGFLRPIGMEKVRKILRECLDSQLQESLERDIISKQVDVIIDFHEKGYYGKRDDKMIKGTTRIKGTKKMRHYLAFSILSKGKHLFAGLEHVAKGQHKTPIINKFLNYLLNMGFKIRYVMFDREFYEAELIKKIKTMGSNIIMPAKLYKKPKQFIKAYLQGKGNRVRRYKISSAPGKKCRFSQVVYLIATAKKGYTLLGIKRDLKRGNLTLKNAMERVFIIMTTGKPKGKDGSWASRILRFYRKRWFIETIFSDLNRIAPSWKSKHDNVRYLDMLMRMLLYNSWKINRGLLKKSRNKKYGKRAWKLINNQDLLIKCFLTSEKKLIMIT